MLLNKEFVFHNVPKRRCHAACWYGNKMIVYGGIGKEKVRKVGLNRYAKSKNFLSDVWELYIQGKNFKWNKSKVTLSKGIKDNYGIANHTMCAVWDVERFFNSFNDKYEYVVHPAFEKWKVK